MGTEHGDAREPDPSSSPAISVLITAYRRITYLREAIDSVLNQTLERARFEVVVTAGVHDAVVEEYCRTRGVTFLFEESRDLGFRIDRALDACGGEIIVLLEDDDEFDPAKLAAVVEEFDHHPDLAYYHNGFVPIGPDGAPLDARGFRREATSRSQAEGLLYSPGGPAAERFDRLAPLDPSWNTSSVAFRKELLTPYRGELEHLSFLADRLIYLTALLERRSILLDPRPLTRYRLHGENASGHGGRGSGGPNGFDELIGRVRSISVRQLADLERLRAMLLRSSSPELAEPITHALPPLRLFATLRNPEARRTDVLRGLWELVRSRGGTPGESPWASAGASSVAIYLLSLLYLLNPRWAPRAYLRLRELSRPVVSASGTG